MKPPAFLCLLAIPWLAAAAEPSLSLADAVRMAVASHPDVAKAKAAADGLKGRIREVRSQALPDISVTSGFMRWRDPSLLNASGLDKWPEEFRAALIPVPVNIFDYSINVKQPLYTAGKVGTALRLASVEAEGALVEIDRAQQDVALGTTKAFYDLLWAQRYLTVVQETQQQKIQHAEMARTLFKNGVATEVDMLRSDVAVANGQPDVVRAQNAIQQARALLNYYLGRPTDQAVELAGDFPDVELESQDLSELMKEAERRRPELLRLRISQRSAATQVELAKAESRMRLDFSAAYGLMARQPKNLVNPDFTRWTAGVNFTFPLFDGFRRSGMTQQAVANERSIRSDREKAEQQVRLALQQVVDEIRAAQETLRAVRANVGQAERVLAMMRNNYKFGAATTLDIVDAQTALSVARTNVLRGLHDAAVARANLRWTMGMTPWE